MDQEINRKYDENAPNIYELNNVDTNEIECPLYIHGNPYLIQEFCAHNSILDSSSPHDVFYNMFTPSTHLAVFIIMHMSSHNMKGS